LASLTEAFTQTTFGGTHGDATANAAFGAYQRTQPTGQLTFNTEGVNSCVRNAAKSRRT
jgi:hypothetical protein